MGVRRQGPERCKNPAMVRFPGWRRVVQSIPFRLMVAALVLAAHLGAFAHMANSRYDIPFNSAPGQPPTLEEPTQHRPTNWDRLVVARWDAAHYMAVALRGYSQCPKALPAGTDLRPYFTRCDITFYPTYSVLGRAVMWVTGLPVDYSLLAVSLFCSFLFLFLWTGKSVVDVFGLRVTWIAFVIFNAFSTGYTLVSILTEPPALLFTLCAFLALHRRWWLLGALFAGAATALRINAAGTGLAFALTLLVSLFVVRPQSIWGWLSRIIAMPLSGWGVMAVMGYHWWRFGDPFLYSNAHSQAYAHSPDPLAALWPKLEWVLRGIDHPLHEVVVLLLVTIVFLFGHRRAMRGVFLPEQVFFYGQAGIGMAISLLGSSGIAFAGMNRYTIMALLIFFALAAALQRRPVLLAVWLAASLFHYFQVDMCDFVGGLGPNRLVKCHVQQWMRAW